MSYVSKKNEMTEQDRVIILEDLITTSVRRSIKSQLELLRQIDPGLPSFMLVQLLYEEKMDEDRQMYNVSELFGST